MMESIEIGDKMERDYQLDMASLCDYLNTYARECGVKEANWYSLKELREVIDRIMGCERSKNQKLKEGICYWSYCTRMGMLKYCPEKNEELTEFNRSCGVTP